MRPSAVAGHAARRGRAVDAGRAVAHVHPLPNDLRGVTPRRRRRALSGRARRRRAALVVVAGIAIVLGSVWGIHDRDSKAAVEQRAASPTPKRQAAIRPPGPIPGYLLIADRGNNRVLLVDSRRHIVWQYPRPGADPAAPFRFDDDAFFAPGFTRIISNQEDQHTIQVLSFPQGRLLWFYGHVNVRGSSTGYL